MDIKITKKPNGIPTAHVATSWGERADGARVVVAHLTREDAHGIIEGVGRLSMSPDEARELARKLLAEADRAEMDDDTTSRRGLRARARDASHAAEAFVRDATAAIETCDSIRASLVVRRRMHASTKEWMEQQTISGVLEELSRVDGFLEVEEVDHG